MLLPYLPLTIEYNQVLRYLGVSAQAKLDERILQDIQQCITWGKLILKPTAVSDHVPIADLPGLDHIVKNCLSTSVVAITMGENIEEETARLFRQGQTTKGVILDAVATVAVEEATSRVITILAQQQRRQGLFPTPSFAPGNQHLAIEYLPVLLRLAGGEQIGISLNEYFQMTPAKSLCFLVGWTPTPGQSKDKCQSCNKKNCQFRSVRTEGEINIVF